MIHGLEWLFIALILFILILGDPGKIPQIARALAEAKKEYEKATAMVQELVENVEREAEKQAKELELEEKLIKRAKELGIETYGKTETEIAQEILIRDIRAKAEKEGRKADGKEGERAGEGKSEEFAEPKESQPQSK